jgi:hypothetical protein
LSEAVSLVKPRYPKGRRRHVEEKQDPCGKGRRGSRTVPLLGVLAVGVETDLDVDVVGLDRVGGDVLARCDD